MKFLLVLAAAAAAGWYYLKPLPPGVGPNAEAGKRVSGSVIRAIEAFRNDRGIYPEDLEDMAPEYLSKVPTLSNGSQLGYHRNGVTYILTFNYSNPLPVHCSYQPGAKWGCEWF